MSKKLKHSFFDHNNREAKALREACMEVTTLRCLVKAVPPYSHKFSCLDVRESNRDGLDVNRVGIKNPKPKNPTMKKKPFY